MIYVFDIKGCLKNNYDNIEECYKDVKDKFKGRENEVKYRIEKSIEFKTYYYNHVFSENDKIEIDQYMSIKNKTELFKVGDIIGDGQYEIVNIDRYESGAKRFTLKCSSCNNIKTSDYKGIIYITKCNGCSLNEFKISKCGKHWVGTTQNGEDFLFNGDDAVVEYIKTYTWRRTVYGYFQNSKGEKLHRVVMKINDPNIFVNHIGGNKYDCRKEMLSISDCLDNSKEKKINSRNNTGIIGLMKRRDKYVGNIKINDLSIYSKYKERDEALIDLLIMQKHYGFRHNVNMFDMIENISESRYKEVIDNCERQLNRKINHTVKSTNKLELSECGTFYWVYDDDSSKDNNKFKISIEDKEKILKGKWHVAYDSNNCEKTYIHGAAVIDNKRKTLKLHRYILDLLDVKYKMWFIDHINGDELDNRRENLVITNALGNGHKCNAKGYYERSDSPGVYRASGVLGGVKYEKTFYTEQEAIAYVSLKRNEFMNNRVKFYSKDDLDKYLELAS